MLALDNNGDTIMATIKKGAPFKPIDLNGMSEEDYINLQASMELLKLGHKEEEETEEEIEEEEEEETPESGESEEEESEEEESDDELEISGIKLSKDRILALHNLDEYLNSNPDVAQRLSDSQQALQQFGGPPPATPPYSAIPEVTPPSPPEGLDLDDPTIKALWDNQVALSTQLQAQQIELQRREQLETRANVEAAVDQWNSKYKLSAEDLLKIRQKAGESNIALSMINSGRSVIEATTAALESAFWTDPTYRTQFLAAQSNTDSRKDKMKRQKISALGGRGTTAGSPKPVERMTQDERNSAMIADIAEYMTS